MMEMGLCKGSDMLRIFFFNKVQITVWMLSVQQLNLMIQTDWGYAILKYCIVVLNS